MQIYRDCKFCHGRGCLACPGEEMKAKKLAGERRLNKNPLSEDAARFVKMVSDATGIKPDRVTPFRYENGIYSDCPKCYGVGCVSCPEEADKEYKRQFPDGPKPIATIRIDPENPASAANKLQELLQQAVKEQKSGEDLPEEFGSLLKQAIKEN